MAKPLQLELTPEQRRELERVRDTDDRPYLRERAAAILKIADGQSVRQVALHGLLKRRQEETVGRWVRRYLDEGLAGLVIKPGRGRKPAFSPSAPNAGSCCRRITGSCAAFAPSIRLET